MMPLRLPNLRADFWEVFDDFFHHWACIINTPPVIKIATRLSFSGEEGANPVDGQQAASRTNPKCGVSMRSFPSRKVALGWRCPSTT
jgi:hypothetical protein